MPACTAMIFPCTMMRVSTRRKLMPIRLSRLMLALDMYARNQMPA